MARTKKSELFDLKPPAPVLTENDIEAQAKAFWQSRGWTVIRNHVGTFRSITGRSRIRMGAAGMADYLVLKPGRFGRGLIAWVEIKRPGERPDPHQLEWLQCQRLQGYEAVWFDSLPPLVEWFNRTFGPRHDGRVG